MTRIQRFSVIITIIMMSISLFTVWSLWENVKKDKLISEIQDSLQTYKTLVTEKGQQLYLQEQRVVSLEYANKQYDSLIKNLKEIGVKNFNTIVQLQTENRRLKVELSYKPDTVIDTIVVKDGPDLKTYLRVPMPFEHKGDPWLYIQGTVKTTGVTLDSMIVYGKPSIVLGWETKFLKKDAPIIVYQDLNPYTVVTDMNNAIIQTKPKWYKTPWFHRAEGALMILAGAITINQFR